MRKLLNNLYAVSEDAYLSLDGENVIINRDKERIGRFPLHALETIISFSYAGASPALMGACAERNISLVFCTQSGRFLARTIGESNGNVLLRRTQYRIADNPTECGTIVRNFIYGKVYNARWSIERTKRDHAMRIDEEKLSSAINKLKSAIANIQAETDIDALRGLEGAAAYTYFGVFDEMILGDKKVFFFDGRSRRPPTDNVNALLSFAYTLLSNDCASALEAVGLDSYVGFLHRDKPGRQSLANDLMEELRPCMADRFVLTLINNRVINASDFSRRENGAVFMSDNARKTFLEAWRGRKREELTHPYLKEKVSWGLIPYIQSMLLARALRGDIDGYPPFLWK